MTALTMPARPKHDAGLRPVPWRRMAWVTWRQRRAALGGVAAFLGAFAVYLWLTGLQMHHAAAAYCHPAGSLGCAINFTGRHGETAIIVSIALQAVPALIGAFIGAPVLARELETGTFRYAWTQGIGRRRWTVGKLVPLAVAVTAAAGAFTVLFAWYNQPWVAAGYVTPFSARVFDLLGIAFAAWTLAAFAIGALAGMLIRRVVPAIAATLAVYAGLAFATGLSPSGKAFLKRKAEQDENRRATADALRSFVGTALVLRYELRDEPEPADPASEPGGLSHEELVKRLVEEFDAQEVLDDDEETENPDASAQHAAAAQAGPEDAGGHDRPPRSRSRTRSSTPRPAAAWSRSR